MNELINIENKELAMSSREIAELVGLRHDNVKRTIKTLVDKGVIVQPQIEDEQFTDKLGRNRTEKSFLFVGERGKRDSIIIVAQLSPEFTAKLVDRWQELENQNKFMIPKTYHEALLLAAEQTKKAYELEEEKESLMIELKQTKEEKEQVSTKLEVTENALDRIAELDGGLTLTLTAKNLQIKRTDLIQEMRKQKWIYKTTVMV